MVVVPDTVEIDIGSLDTRVIELNRGASNAEKHRKSW
jgi:hypothetical protein